MLIYLIQIPRTADERVKLPSHSRHRSSRHRYQRIVRHIHREAMKAGAGCTHLLSRLPIGRQHSTSPCSAVIACVSEVMEAFADPYHNCTLGTSNNSADRCLGAARRTIVTSGSRSSSRRMKALISHPLTAICLTYKRQHCRMWHTHTHRHRLVCMCPVQAYF